MSLKVAGVGLEGLANAQKEINEEHDEFVKLVKKAMWLLARPVITEEWRKQADDVIAGLKKKVG